MRGLLITIVSCVLSSAALADPPSEDVSQYTFHEHQFGLSARLGLGYRALFTKQSSTYCGETDANQSSGNATVCTGRAPLALDLEASYAVKRAVELLAAVRLGLERDFGSTAAASDGPHQLDLAIGARIFFSEAKHVKLFFQPMLLFDFTGYAAGSFDFGGRILQGVWIDLHKTYGFYVYLGETAELAKFFGGSRWLDAEFEGGIGFQGRYP